MIVSIYDGGYGKAVRLLGERERLTFGERCSIVDGFVGFNIEKEKFAESLIEHYSLERLILCEDGDIEIFYAHTEEDN